MHATNLSSASVTPPLSHLPGSGSFLAGCTPEWLLGACCAQVMDMLVEQTHEIRHEMRSNERPMRFTDTRLDEQERGISLKMVPMSLLMPASSGKSYLMNLIDTPGAASLGRGVACGFPCAAVLELAGRHGVGNDLSGPGRCNTLQISSSWWSHADFVPQSGACVCAVHDIWC